MVHQEDITIVNIYALSHGPPSFTKQMLQSLESHDTIRARDFNTRLSYLHGASPLKISKEISKLNYTIDHLDLTGIYRKHSVGAHLGFLVTLPRRTYSYKCSH